MLRENMELPKASIWKAAPELAIPEPPAILADGRDLWLSYEVAGSSPLRYAIVQFVDVIDHRLSPINDEGIGRHPYAKVGLQFYSFNEITGSKETARWHALKPRHWVVTFKDNTLDVLA